MKTITKKDFKTDFEKWHIEVYLGFDGSNGFASEGLKSKRLEEFYTLYRSEQWGVYVDFFDSVGIYVEQNQYIKLKEKLFGYNISEDKESSIWGVGDVYSCKTREEAREKALEKAIEIYNN